jgi:copper chaperone
MGRCRLFVMYDLKIEGMTCEGCVGSVKKSILSQDPTAKVEIDLTLGTAKIESKLPKEAFKTAIEDAGFDVTL